MQDAFAYARNAHTLNQRLYDLIMAAVGMAAVLVVSLRLPDLFTPQDEGVLLVYPDLILRGYIPYKDFAALYSPGGFYLIAGAFHVFGESVSIERAVGALYWFLIVAAIFLVGSRVNRTIAILSGITALSYLSLSISTIASPHLAAFACMLFAVFYANQDDNSLSSKLSILLSGSIAGLTFWFKQDLGVIAVLAALVSIAPRRIYHLRSFAIGLLLPISGLMVFTIAVGPAKVFDSLVQDAIRSSPGRFVPIHLGLDLAVVAICCTIQCVVAVLVHRSLQKRLVCLAQGIATLSTCLSLSMLHRLLPGSLGFFGDVVVGLTVISLGVFFLHLKVDRPRAIAAISFCFFMGLIPVYVLHLNRPQLSGLGTFLVVSEPRSVPVLLVGDTKGADLQEILNDVRKISRPGDGLFVGPSDLRFANYNDTFIYYLLPNLRPVSRYLEMNPGCANRQDSGLTEEISGADWLILTTRFDHWKEQNASVIPGPSEPNEFVRTHFCMRSQHGDWRLLQRCS